MGKLSVDTIGYRERSPVASEGFRKASEKLKKAIRRLGRRLPRPPLDLAPDSPFDALLEQRMRHLEHQVEELKQRVNGLMIMLAGAVVVQILLSLLR